MLVLVEHQMNIHQFPNTVVPIVSINSGATTHDTAVSIPPEVRLRRTLCKSDQNIAWPTSREQLGIIDSSGLAVLDHKFLALSWPVQEIVSNVVF